MTKISIITPHKIEKETDAEMVVVPGVEGEFGVMDQHAPFLSVLKAGFVKIYSGDKIIDQIFINSGICDVSNDNCTILTEEIIDIDSLNKDELSEKLKTLSENLKTTEKQKDINKIQIEIDRIQTILDLV